MAYCQLLTSSYLPWAASVGHNLGAGGDTVFQEDGAPSHTSKHTRAVWALHAGGVERLSWPACSPDLNILDWYVWGACKTKITANRAMTDIELMAAVHEAATEIRDKMNIAKVSEGFVKRVRACIRAAGGVSAL